jgi:methionyl-tRNA synthetase
MKPYTIATSIMYPNGTPHMGHALEIVQADALARAARLFTDQSVFLQTGTDEHGLKMVKAAAAVGSDINDFVDKQVEGVVNLYEALQISYDKFVRTTSPEHQAMAAAVWSKAQAAGLIEKRTYRAWYNVKQEEFLGSCEEHPDPSVFGVDPAFIEKIEEENYFFLASRYTKALIEVIQTDQIRIYPANRKQEMLHVLQSTGLHDVSISRDRSRLGWGIPVPGDPEQVMYVWFDALSNYLTAVATVTDGVIVPGQHWPTAIHVIGKDIQRFHALLWPAMLMAIEVDLPKAILVHGFMLSGGRAMSKSLGNGIDPQEFITAYGSDALRWYLLGAIPTMDDGDITRERFSQVYDSALRNEYGNLVSRITTMVHRYCGGVIPVVHGEHGGVAAHTITQDIWREYHRSWSGYDMMTALQHAMRLNQWMNQRIEERAPWKLAKEAVNDPTKQHELETLLHELLTALWYATLMLAPVIPHTTRRVMHEVFGVADLIELCRQRELGIDSDIPWDVLQPGQVLGELSTILFPPVV